VTGCLQPARHVALSAAVHTLALALLVRTLLLAASPALHTQLLAAMPLLPGKSGCSGGTAP